MEAQLQKDLSQIIDNKNEVKENLKKLINLLSENKEIAAIGNIYYKLALNYLIIGNFVRAKYYSSKYVNFSKEYSNLFCLGKASFIIGKIYLEENNYYLCLTNLKKAEEQFSLKKNFYHLSKTQKTIGLAYEILENHDKDALYYYEESLKNAKKARNCETLSEAYNGLASIYIKLNKYSEATSYLHQSILIEKEENNNKNLGYTYYEYGKLYSNLGNFNLSEKFYKASIDILEKHSDIHRKHLSILRLCELYIKYNFYDIAKELIYNSYNYYNDAANSRLKIKMYYTLSVIYNQENDYLNYVKYKELYLLEKEAQINNETKKILDNNKILLKLKRKENISKLKDLQLKNEKIKLDNDKIDVQNKQNFLSLVNHELRTPLNAIISIANIVKTEKAITPDLIEMLDFSAYNLKAIVDNFLLMTKLTNDEKLNLNLSKLNLSESIILMTQQLEIEFRKKDVAFIIENNVNKDLYFEFDIVKLSQILSNLLKNALKFTNKGSVTLTVDHDFSNDTIHFVIKDTGIGILKKDLKNLFVRFKQVNNNVNNDGVGLGLFIVQNLVNAHGGTISVDSKINHGTEIKFSIIAKKTKNINHDLINTEMINITQGKKILLVDDNKVNLLITKKMLSKYNLDVIAVNSGSAAIKIYKNTNINMVLTDIQMPEMNGFQLTETLKSINGNIPVVAFTANHENENLKNYSLFFDKLSKPIDICHLEKIMKKLFKA